MNGELERIVALERLEESPYPDEKDLRSDTKFFLDKLEWSKEDLDLYLERPKRDHAEFGSSVYFQNFLLKLKSFIS